MEVFFIIVFMVGFYALYTRQGAILDRINAVERLISRGQSVAQTGGVSTSSVFNEKERTERATVDTADWETPPESVATEQFATGGVDQHAVPAPAPAPAPSSDYLVTSATDTAAPEKNAFADEAQEEKGARWLGRIGGFMVFLGMVFFVNYAIEVGWLTPPGQFILGILVGLIMLGLGHFLRVSHLGNQAYERYANALLGGGIAVLYLIIYAGFSILHYAGAGGPIISQTTAFVLMILVTATTMILSVVSNSRFLAISAVLGGFLTPVMVSTGENHLVTLALYIAMLNTGVMGMGWFKKWTWLNYGAMAGTVILFGGWMDQFYWRNPDGQLGMTFFFLTIFFLQFLVTAVLHHFRNQEESTLADFAFLTLNAGVYFLASYGILRVEYKDSLGFFALALSVLHLAVAYRSYMSNLRDRKLNLFLVGVAVVFLSIAVPLQLSGYWISISWLTEAVVLIGVGVYLREYVLNMFGWIVFAFGLLSVLGDVSQLRYGNSYGGGSGILSSNFTPFANSAFLMLVMSVGAMYAIGYLYAKFESGDKWKQILSGMVIAANLLTLYAVSSEIGIKYDQMIRDVERSAQVIESNTLTYQGNGQTFGDVNINTYESRAGMMREIGSLQNQKTTVRSIFWTLYAILLLALGFMKRIRALRIGGLILIFLTFAEVFMMVWGFGDEIYRIVASTVFGVLALIASFIYVKYKHLLKDIIYDNHE